MRRVLPILFALLLALAPAAGFARPGLGHSYGSRGSATWSAPPGTASAPGGASPFTRSMTPNYGSQGYGYGGYGYHRPLFGGGMLGGFIGGGLLGLMLGRGFFGFHGGFGFLGVLFQLALLFWIGRWLFRNMMGAPAMAGGGFSRGYMPPGMAPGGGSGYGGGGRQTLTISQPDYQQFTQVLNGVQLAWTRRDLVALQAMATPEMVGYFNEQLSDLASRGLRNEVRNVQLQQGDLSEAWSEGGREYATVSLRFSMVDVTYDQAGRVVDGSDTERVTVTEFWTFVRRLPGHWILSAIQQTR